MPAPSVPNLIFDLFITRFEDEGWKIVKSLIVSPGPFRDMAEIDPASRVITIYPIIRGERDDPPAKNLFHEILLHLGLGLGPEVDKPSTDGERIENWWWNQLSSSRKKKLARLLDS